MEGVVHVRNPRTSIASYAVDGFGNKINDFPLYNFTEDRNIKIGRMWNPQSIVTNEPVSFIIDFFEYPKNSRLHLCPYNFVIMQNNTETYRTNEVTQVGSSVRHMFLLHLEKLLSELKVGKIRVHLCNLVPWSIKIHTTM